MVRHQEARTERSGNLDPVADLEVAKIVAADAAHRAPLVVLEHPLHRERDVVVAGPLAVARARDGILPGTMRAPRGVQPRRDDPDRLALEHGKRHGAEIEHDMVGIVVPADLRHPHIADDGRRDEFLRRARPVEIGVGVRGGPRRNDGGEVGGGECALAFRLRGRRRRGFRGKVKRGDAGGGKVLGRQLRRQRVPAELRLDAIGARPRHDPPIVDAAGRTGGNAGHAKVANRGVHHVVALVVRDRPDRASRLAGVAADADLRIDQVLPDDRGVDVFQCASSSPRAASRRPIEARPVDAVVDRVAALNERGYNWPRRPKSKRLYTRFQSKAAFSPLP